MKRNFFYFAWRELFRSASFKKSMAAKGVIIFLVVYFSIVALFLGFNLKEIISKDYPGIPPVQAFNSLLFILCRI